MRCAIADFSRTSDASYRVDVGVAQTSPVHRCGLLAAEPGSADKGNETRRPRAQDALIVADHARHLDVLWGLQDEHILREAAGCARHHARTHFEQQEY